MESEQAGECYLGHLLEYALGREVSDASGRLQIDDSVLATMRDTLAAGDGSLVAAFSEIAASDALALRDGSNLPLGGAP